MQSCDPALDTPLDTTHLRSRSPLSRIGTVHDAFSPLSTALGDDRCDQVAAIRQPRSRWPPQRSSSSPHRPLRAAGCGNASPHYLRPHCMIPRHDLGSSPRRAACPAGLLPPLHRRRLFAGAQQLPAMPSAAPLHLPAATIGYCSWCLSRLTLTALRVHPAPVI